MLEAFSDSERVFLTRIVGTKIIPTLLALAKGGVSYAFNQWNQMCEEQREVERAIATEAEVRRIMRESTRGNRTAQIHFQACLHSLRSVFRGHGNPLQ